MEDEAVCIIQRSRSCGVVRGLGEAKLSMQAGEGIKHNLKGLEFTCSPIAFHFISQDSQLSDVLFCYENHKNQYKAFG